MVANEFMFNPKKELGCKICGNKFSPLKENRYTVERTNLFTKKKEECDAFDCPFCGCQVIVNTRYPKKYASVEVDFDRLKKNINMLKCDDSTLKKTRMVIDDFGIKKEGDEYVYKGLKYDMGQIYVIWLGLMDGLDVSAYADPKFDNFQMSQIRQGLEHGINVSAYADPKIDWRQMGRIMIDLEKSE